MEKNAPLAVEMETFLPKDGSNHKENGVNGKYQVTPRDLEAVDPLHKGEFDPFRERKLVKPTTDCDTLTHLLKASLGTGILAMPDAFRNSGLIVGIFATFFVALVCTHCAYILVECAHELYRRTRSTAMNFAEVSEIAFDKGPEWGRKFAKPSRYIIQVGLFITYFGTCSVYSVIVAENFAQVVEYHTCRQMDVRLCIALLMVPLILLAWIPNLKYLAPVSMVANLFMAVGLVITFYYLVIDLPPLNSVELVAPIGNWPQFFSITIFAIEAIGVVMPLENHMKTPQHFTGICGVLNKGMGSVTLIYLLLGFLGYVRYGNTTLGSVTLNLDIHQIPAQVVKILIALAVYCTYGLQFYVCLEIGWDGIKDRFVKHPLIANYVLRTVLVILSVVLAIAVPMISPFIGLLGAFCFSILGLFVPVCIEVVTFWDKGFGLTNWRTWKNVFVCIFALMALVFGSASALKEIVGLYTNEQVPKELVCFANLTTIENSLALANTTGVTDIMDLFTTTAVTDMI